MPLKVVCWNVEHAARLIGEPPSPVVADRRRRVRETIEAIDPDILCLEEGPRGEIAIDAFATRVLNGDWVPVLLDPSSPLGANDASYQIKGNQWIWFLVRAALSARCRVQAPLVWQHFVGGKTWKVNHWGEIRAQDHGHYRHPQLLIYRLPDGTEIEIIGVHLKSKINKLRVERTAAGDLQLDYVKEALRARTELATEARNVRAYVAAKFGQVPDPAIMIMGDCNDGPGHDFFELQYLFFDLISNIQGDVLIAERFFNHALFDFPGELRWSAKYRDDVPRIPASQNPLLLDHILISQPLCRGNLPLIANAGAGRVEHEAYERANAGASANEKTSDHRPVSCVLDDVGH